MSEPTPKTACRLMVRVRFHECDPLGHVNNAVYLNYLEQAAIDHALLVGWSQQRLEREAGGVFVARRHELDYLKPAYEGDHLEVLTWAATMGMASALRKYVIRRVPADQSRSEARELIDFPDVAAFESGDVIVHAETVWTFVAIERRRPMRVPQHVIDDFVTAAEE